MNCLLLREINVTSILIVIAIVAVLAIVFSSLIVLVSKLCAVKEDQRVAEISENLAGANCGGCGYAGCSDFAKALVDGKATINDCGATPCEAKELIAKILDVPFTATPKTFAVVKCAGGTNCKDKFDYVGIKDCTVQATIIEGRKLCSSACLGGGSCVTACTNGGVSLADGAAVVDKRLCTSCGACVKKCPKNLIELIPSDAKVYVACSSNCKGKEVVNTCMTGCIGCGLCAKNCPNAAITMVDNLAVIDYSKCNGCLTCVAKCPRKCIKEI